MLNYINKIISYTTHYFWSLKFQREILKTKNKKQGKITLFKKEFYYHHGMAFYNTYLEIFQTKIYEFNAKDDRPVIIDCGANMGLSILYFSKCFPEAEIIAFEPDEEVLAFLEKNIVSQNLQNVELLKVGVWTEITNLEFYTDYGLGGRIGKEYKNQDVRTIETARLKDYLKRSVDMLKIDIEGPEFLILQDCEDVLSNISNIFVEYHSCHNEDQKLDDLLGLLKRNGFRYHLKESFSRRKPFVEKHVICERYDMAINVFAYRAQN